MEKWYFFAMGEEMETSTVRIGVTAKRALEELARQDGLSLQEELAALVEGERCRRILDATNVGYEACRTSPAEWDAFQRDVEMWEVTAADGLADI
jgi:hypothetical protein